MANTNEGRTGVRFMRPLNRVMERYIPSSLTFAIVLTLIVAVLALVLTDAGPVQVLTSWGEGLSGLLEFMTQMALVLLFGHMLANTGPVRRFLAALARVPTSSRWAYVFVFVIAALTSLLAWGLGLVVGALLAREIAVQGRQRGMRLHFPLLVAAGYSGFIVWHMGYTASGPLTAATPDSFLATALDGRVLPVSQTIFAGWNMLAAAVMIVVCAVLIWLLTPRQEESVYELPEHVGSEQEQTFETSQATPADRVDSSRVLPLLVGLALAIYLLMHFINGGGLTLNIVNWSFLALILLLVRSPFEVMHLTRMAAANVGEILVQFPLYAGILGMMSATGLIAMFSNSLIAIAGPHSFGVLALISAGVVNFFVPSGGGQFAVQGPIMLDAAKALGVEPSVAIMALAYGDQWTNMLQPFWALPVLAIAGLKMRDILGYTTITFLGSGVVMAMTLILVSL